MRILEDHDHRLLARQTFELADQRLQCPLLLALRAEVRQRMALRSGQRQQIGEKSHILVRRCGASQHGFELLQLGCRRIVAYETRRAAELVDEWIECAVLVIGRAEIAQAQVRLGVEALRQ